MTEHGQRARIEYARSDREDGDLRCELPAHDEAVWRG